MRDDDLNAGNRCLRALSWCLTLAFAGGALAQAPAPVCKYIDANGNIVFSNMPPEKGQRKISCMGAD